MTFFKTAVLSALFFGAVGLASTASAAPNFSGAKLQNQGQLELVGHRHGHKKWWKKRKKHHHHHHHHDRRKKHRH